MRHGYTLVVVLMGWLIFRATDFSQLIVFVSAMVSPSSGSALSPHVLTYLNNEVLLIFVLGVMGSTPILQVLNAKTKGFFERRAFSPTVFAVVRD